jgi:tRNA (guanine37-N1)-methyltransferase
MVLACQPIFDCYENIEKKDNFEFIMLTPQGEKFNQKIATELSQKEQIILLCGHYEGFDERIRIGLKPREISIGDFVLTGGEIPACLLVDAVARLIDGVLSDPECHEKESISSGMLEYPQYTRPYEFHGVCVPDVLISGHHENIDKWRHEEALRLTKQNRPDIIEKFGNKI